MNDQVFGPVNKAVNSANALGALGVTAVWALFCMVLIAYIVWTLKQAKASDKQWQDIRLKEALSDQAIGEALSRVAEKVAQLQIIIMRCNLPGGSNVNTGLDK